MFILLLTHSPPNRKKKIARENFTNTTGQDTHGIGTNDPNNFVVPLLKALMRVYNKDGYLNILEVGAGNGRTRQFILAILKPYNIRVQWVATDLIQCPHAPDVRCLSGLRAVTPELGYIGYNVLLMLFPTPNDTWSTHVLERGTDLNIDCAVIFGGETGHSDGHYSILPVLVRSWNQNYREVFAHMNVGSSRLGALFQSIGTNEKAIELYFRR